jgi:hypothetical protein
LITVIKQKNKATWTIKATGMLKVCSILRIVTDVNFEKSSNHRIWIQLRHDSQTVDIDELDFVAAVYDGKWYLGKVITIDYEENEAKINFMEQCPGKIAGIYKSNSSMSTVCESVFRVRRIVFVSLIFYFGMDLGFQLIISTVLIYFKHGTMSWKNCRNL